MTKYRAVLADFFLKNQLSALQLFKLADSSSQAGAQGVGDLAAAGAGGRHPQNLSRDVMRSLMKGVNWPDPYYITLDVLRKGDVVQEEVAVLLPHECLHHIIEAMPEQDRGTLQAGPGHHMQAVVAEWCQKLHMDPSRVVPIGLHGDGVPYSAKMGDSLEQMSWNFCVGRNSFRILFAALPRSLMAGTTMEALLALFAWSMRCMLSGQHPSARHDGNVFTYNDRKRKAMASKPFVLIGALLQVRGDWDWYKKIFNFPGWANLRICWRCRASRVLDDPLNFTNCGPNGAWRGQRLDGATFLAEMRAGGTMPTCLLACPGLAIEHFVIDWMHCVDLGVGQDMLGQLFWDILPLLGGANRDEQVGLLWSRVRAFYAQHKPASQLKGLTAEMLRVGRKAPKLRSKAAECRYLLPFGAALAAEMADGTEYRATVAAVAQKLLDLANLVAAEVFDAAACRSTCMRFCVLYCSLGARAAASGEDWKWRPKPKLHMLQELCEFLATHLDASPREFWNYTDESWCGWLASTGGRRGGAKSASGISLNLIQRFRACAKELTEGA